MIGAFAATDLPEMENRLNDPVPAGMHGYPRPVLANGKVRYVGEPIAVVVAEDASTAADAAGAVAVELSPLDGAGDVLSATRADAPVLHAELGSNVAGRYQTGFGDITAAFAAEATIVRQTFRLNRVIGGYMEPRASAAAMDADTGQLTVWTSTQWVYGVRDRIAMLLGLEPDRVRVLAPDVGGGFGAKGQVYPEEILVAALARRLGRPVRWVATRTEDTQATAHSHGDSATAELAANADGTLRGMRVRLLHDVGAYAAPGLGQSDNILSHVVSAYRLPALDAESTLVYTNAVPDRLHPRRWPRGGQLYRRALDGSSGQAAWARPGRATPTQPHRSRSSCRTRPATCAWALGRWSTTGVTIRGCWPAPWRRSAMRRPGSGRRPANASAWAWRVVSSRPASSNRSRRRFASSRMATCTPTSARHRAVRGTARCSRKSSPSIWAGRSDRVQVFVGDTTAVSNSANTAGSRSALEVGNAAAAVAREARRLLIDRAQTALEVAADDLDVGPSGAEVRGVPGRQVGLADLLDAGGPLTAHAMFQSSGAYTAAVHAVTLAVDPETALPRVLGYAIAHDCGQPINPLLVNGQLQGGLVHGVGYALMEAAVYQPDGTFITANFLDYALPGRGLPAAMQPTLVEVRAPVLGNNPEGFKGVGETGTIAAPAAIVAAIEDALRTLGIDATLSTLPVTPTVLFDALSGRNGS